MARSEDQKRWREKHDKKRIEVYLPADLVEAIDKKIQSASLSLSGRGAVIELALRAYLK